MKNSYLLEFKLVFVLFVLVVAGCSKNNENEGNGKGNGSGATLSISPNVTAIQFSANGMKAAVTSSQSTASPVGTELTTTGEAIFTVSTNQSSWSVTQPTGSWVTVTKDGNRFKVSVQENTSTNGRTPVKLTITAGNATSLTLDILQPGADATVSIDPLVSKLLFSADGKTATVGTVPEGSSVAAGDVLTDDYQTIFAIVTNQPTWTYEKVPDNESSSWLNVNITGAYEITVAATKNVSETARTDVEVRLKAGSAPVYTLTFEQLGNNLQPAQVETLQPQVNGTVVTVGGNIINVGTPAYTSRGVCWSTMNDPTTSDNHTLIAGTGTGIFTDNINLAPGAYYMRAFAINSAGTVYGLSEAVTVSPQPGLAQVSTAEPSNIQPNSATLGGTIVTAGTPAYTERGICWATWAYPTIDNNKQQIAGTGTGSFSATVTGLEPKTGYYVRAYATNAAGTAYGEQRFFTTADTPPRLPVLSTIEAFDIGTHSASTGVNITDAGYPPYSQSGVCYSTSQNPDLAGPKVFASYSGESGAFTVQLNELVPGVTWYARAYAINDAAGLVYGNQISFTTLTESVSPVFTTLSPPTNITQNSATFSGSITNAGTPAYTERGFCYSTTQNPVVTGNKIVVVGSGTGTFTATPTTLSPGTAYYVRTYVIFQGEPVYGNQINFTTLTESVSPVFTTLPPTNITQNSAALSINITNAGTPVYTEKGFCYSTSQNPIITDSKITVGGLGTGTFTATPTTLSPATAYYVRAYVIFQGEPVYGNQVSFTTATGQNLPVLTTLEVTNIGTNQATMGGNISNVGTPPYTERGVCWSSGATPTISNSHASDGGSGTGVFSVTVDTGLAPGITYSVRAYAIGSTGVSYGNTVTFTTQNVPSSSITLTGPSSVTGNFNLTWTYTWPEIVSTTDRYELEYSDNGGASWQTLMRYGSGVRTSPFTDQINVDANDVGKTYSFRVKALSNGTYTPYSNIINVYVASLGASTEANPSQVNIVRAQFLNSSIANTASSNPGTLKIGRSHFYQSTGSISDHYDYRCLMRFDINSDISGRSIKKATLRLYVNTLADVRTHSLQVGMVAQNWGSNVTYNTTPNRYDLPEIIKPMPTTTTEPWEVDITEIVKAWANRSRSNYGILIWDPSTYLPYSTVDFSTVFSNSGNRKPVLLIEYN